MSRVGKIARLPVDVREEINRRLLDNEPAKTLLAWLNSAQKLRGSAAITPQNLSEWRAGGYQEWKSHNEKVESIRNLSELSYRLAKASDGNLSDGAAAIAGGRILELLEGSDGKELVGLSLALAKLRDADAKLIRSRLAKDELRIKDESLELDKQRFQRQTAELFLKWYKDKKAQEIADSKSAKNVKMEELVQLMFGKPIEDADE